VSARGSDDQVLFLRRGAAVGCGRWPGQRIVARRSNGSAGDYPLSRVGCARGDSIADDQIRVGDYTYYEDPRGPQHFESNVLYHFALVGDRLVIGNDVWFGYRALVMPGVQVGNGAIERAA